MALTARRFPRGPTLQVTIGVDAPRRVVWNPPSTVACNADIAAAWASGNFGSTSDCRMESYRRSARDDSIRRYRDRAEALLDFATAAGM